MTAALKISVAQLKRHDHLIDGDIYGKIILLNVSSK
jgi:hypothetical protein